MKKMRNKGAATVAKTTSGDAPRMAWVKARDDESIESDRWRDAMT
jgi:hypothetical protein